MKSLKRGPAALAGAFLFLSISAGLSTIAVGASTGGEAAPVGCDREDTAGAIVSGPKDPPEVVGTDGDDRILVSGAGKRVTGMAGNDIICYRGGADGVIVDGGEGSDQIYSNNTVGDFIRGGAGNDLIWSTGGTDRVYGDDGDDRIFAGSGDDVLVGGAGNDSVRGGIGSDRLDGADGADRCVGDGDYDWSQACEYNEGVESPAPAAPAASAPDQK